MPKHELEELRLHVQKAVRRFHKPKKPLYGNVCKGFTEQELTRFLSCCRNPKARLAFSLMANLGLRISEAAAIRHEDIDLQHRRLTVRTLKARQLDWLHLHDDVYEQLRAWQEERYDAIVKSGHVLYSEHGHVSSHWLRKEFREAVILAGLDDVYGRSTESLDRPERRLHRLTTHSLRHYFITRVYRTTKDPVTTQKLARHTELGSTQVYIHTAQSELDATMSKVFDKEPFEKRREQADLNRLAEVLRIIR